MAKSMKEITVEEIRGMSLAQKLVLISRELGPLEATKQIGTGAYSYGVTEAHAIVGPVKRACEKFGVIMIPGIKGDIKIEPVKQKAQVSVVDTPNTPDITDDTNAVILSGMLNIKIINADSPDDTYETSWAFTGIERTKFDNKTGNPIIGDPAMAFGKAMTYCYKYFYRTMFNLSSDDDPDNK